MAEVITVRPEGFTIDDIDRFPDDGHRYELIEGSLHVTPPPVPQHGRAARRLGGVLDRACPPDLEVFDSPVGVALGLATWLEPDLVVVRVADIGEKRIDVAPLLVVEVLSPSTRAYDLGTKRLVYEEAGVGAYWVVDPAQPSVTEFRWPAGGEPTERRVTGGQTLEVDWPFPVAVQPSQLIVPGGSGPAAGADRRA